MAPDDTPARTEGWTLRKGTRVATCTLTPHPLGIEARWDVDGELVRSQVFRDLASMVDEVHRSYHAFEEKGWTPEE